MSVLDPMPPDALFAAALRGDPCRLETAAGWTATVPVQRWKREVDVTDRALLAHCAGPTLDVGCGPGRMSRHLLEQGVPALGIDVVAEAVAQARARGVPALAVDVFGQVPACGRWQTVLLADGNVGIGGCPTTLLRRCAELLAEDGAVVVDLAAPGSGIRTDEVRLHVGRQVSLPFPWTQVGPEALPAVAAEVGLRVGQVGDLGDRWFATLHHGSHHASHPRGDG